MKVQETILAILSDMHTGGSTALFLPTEFEGKHRIVKPKRAQIEIYKLFMDFAAEVARVRKDKRLIIVNLGDSIDGFHHGSMQETLFEVEDQCKVHVELMDKFLRRVRFTKGDELHYVTGTEVHVKEYEDTITKDLDATVNDVLTMNINGKWHQFLHHGASRGTGPNEGNAFRNWLRNVYYDRQKDGLQKLDVVWSGHTHGHTYSNYIARECNQFHIMHGIIAPSWQAKTRYGYKVVPHVVNSVGGVYMKIGVDGSINVPKFVVQVTKDT